MGVSSSGACGRSSRLPWRSAAGREKTLGNDLEPSIHGHSPAFPPHSTETGADDLDASVHGHIPSMTPVLPTRSAEEKILADPGAFIETNASVDSHKKALALRGSFFVAA